MLLFVSLIVALAVLSLLGGLSWMKRSTRRRREFLQGAAQYLGLQYLEGDAAYEQMQRERAEEGLPTLPVPEFLERLTRKLVGPRLSGRFRGSRVSVSEEVHSSRSGSHTESVQGLL